ncbi:MAG TPA: hypothetical protein EYP63_07120 [Desulfotomaculum sp.]|nr:hypothetical protein [Desulfotomaculum sp.]
MKTFGYLLLALLLLGGLVLCYFIHPVVGLFMTLVYAGAFWWMRGSKKQIDQVFNEVARQSGLKVVEKHGAYNRLRGSFQGYDTEIGVYSSNEAGIGTLLTSLSGDAGWSGLDINNVTAIKMKHGLPVQKEISRGSNIVITAREAVMVYPYVSKDAGEILEGMTHLARQIKDLERSPETTGQGQ